MEEDIKILESIVKVHNKFLKGCKKETISEKEIKALENLITRYKDIEADNKRLKDKETEKILKILDDTSKATLVQETIKLRTQVKDSIPKSLVKEKIEELDKEKLKYDNDLRVYTLRNTFDFQKEVLQELLERSREDV